MPITWIKGIAVMAEQQRRRASDIDPPKQPWHLDKSVPIGLILAIMAQTTTVIWWASNVTQRINMLETVAIDNKTTSPRLAVLESQLIDIKETLHRIEVKIPAP